tara:strand:+ start:97 stop:930 length:834 start_codon:yes stop_codon:yes gene_type:complete
MLPGYEFLGSAYFKTSKKELIKSLESINLQLYKASATILVLDGEVKNSLEETISEYQKIMNLKIIRLKRNLGLGLALREGLKYCTQKYILRFDTDDYNEPNRSLKQIEYIHTGDYDIISSWVYEYKDGKENYNRIKKIPLTKEKIKSSIYYRNPFNHPSVCFKLQAILSLQGGYRDVHFYEDYDLWIRAVFNDLKLANMEDLLVGMNINNQIESRKGYKLVAAEAKLIKTFRDHSYLYMIKFLPFFLIRSLVRLMPSKVLSYIYNKFLRTKINLDRI